MTFEPRRLSARLLGACVCVALACGCSVDVDGYRAVSTGERPQGGELPDATDAADADVATDAGARSDAGDPISPPAADGSTPTAPEDAGCSNCVPDSSTPNVPMPSKLWTASGSGQVQAGNYKLRILVGPTLPQGLVVAPGYKLRLRSGFER